MDLNLIENSQKKKKNLKDFSELTGNLFESINSIINADIKKNKSTKDSIDYIKNNLKNFIEIYININRNIKNINSKNYIIKNIVDEMLNNVFIRCENINCPEITCIIENYNIEKDPKTKVNVTME